MCQHLVAAADGSGRVMVMEIGVAITRDESVPSTNKVPRIIRHKMPEVLKEMGKVPAGKGK